MPSQQKGKGSKKIGRNRVKCSKYRDTHPGHHRGAVNGHRFHTARRYRPLSITSIT